MAVALVKSAKGTSALATTTASFASATTAGNLIVLGFAADDYNGTPGAGWTQSTGMEQQTFHGGYLWWRISTGETNFSYTIGSATNSAWVIAEFSGVDATPYDISAGNLQNSSSAASYSTPSITPSTGNRLLVGFLGASEPTNLSAYSWSSWLNSFTGIDSIGSGGGGTNDLAGLAYRAVTGNGSTGYSTGATPSGFTQTRSGLIISFKEAAGGTAYTLTAALGTFSLTGKAATLRIARKLSAAAGSFALSGKAATLRVGYKIAASAGSFALSGVAANLKRTYSLASSTGSFVLSGKNAGLIVGYRLTASAGSFSLTGQAASLRVARKLAAGAGSFALTGVDAGLVYVPSGASYTLTASVGSFALTGQSASLWVARKLVAAQGSFSLSGQPASLRFGRNLVASQGSFILTSFEAGLVYDHSGNGYTLIAEAGSFTWVGWNALLTKSRRARSRNYGEYDDYGWSGRRPPVGKFGSRIGR